MDSKTEGDVINHVEGVDDAPSRRGSVGVPTHSEKPVWEQRELYGPSGIRGIFTSRYVFAAAAFATLGGTLFGYEYATSSYVCSVLADGR